MIFRQLFEPVSSTLTYLLACQTTRRAALIDPVLETVERDLDVLAELGVELAWTIETHVHADHVTGASALRERTGCLIAATGDVSGADRILADGARIEVGGLELEAIATPGHTAEHLCFLLCDNSPPLLFTGDCLLIDGCGRTDFQGGDAASLFASVNQRLFVLPDETLVYPGHDYQGRRVSSIGQERARNPRLGSGRGEAEFIHIMAGLNLPRPARIDEAVPANLACGARSGPAQLD